MSVPDSRSGKRRTVHVPVMLREVLQALDLHPGLWVVDGTVGAGGHSQRILSMIQPGGHLIGLDRDATMLARARQVVSGEDVTLRQTSYSELDAVLDELGHPQVDRVLLDLGLSSDQLADEERGFGFQTEAPLDMRFDLQQGESVQDLLRRISVEDLSQLLQEYGDESQSRRLAEAILKQSDQRQMNTASDLRTCIESVLGSRHKGSHPATRIFQALRIAVNRELEHLEHFLDDVLPRRLSAGGVAAIITFHSIEDRMVKLAFRDASRWEMLTRKPLVPSPSEVRLNPRCRSAKLRVVRRNP